MKKLYMLTLACTLCCIATSHAQTRYWVGPVNGNWSNPANWSDGSVSGVSVPNGGTYVAIFETGAPVVNVDITSISLLSLIVRNGVTAKIYSSSTATITASGTGSPDYALLIETGSRLEDSVSADVPFNFELSNGSRTLIDGTWYFGGHNSVSLPSNGPYFTLPSASPTYRMDVNGSLIIGNKGWMNTPTNSTNFLYFNANAELWIARDGLYTPRATWAPTSTIRITGSVTGAAAINGLTTFSIGNLIFDCAGMANEIGWALPRGLTISGNFQVLNTNNNNLVLAFSFAGPGTAPEYLVNGSFEIGNNAWVTLGNNNNSLDKASSLQVDGDFVQSGGRFDLRGSAITAATQPTVLKIKGNFVQSAGTFGCASEVTGANLFVVELNGNAPQNVDIASNTIDNSTNQVKLRMNNVNGAALLKPLTTGQLEWTGSNGIITANGNALTVGNADAGSVSGAGANAFVAGGAVVRKTSANVAYSFPVGGTAYRPCVVTPEDATASEYSARYYPTSYGNTATSTPLYKVSTAEYWDISRSSGSNASITLSLAAAVPGAFGPDKVVVAHFNGSSWESAKGTTGTEITPGNSSTGSATSEILSSFSPFTFGVVPGSPLPVYLVTFNGKKLTNTSAKLDWTITASSNPDRFEILRSEDGTSFHQIGTVRAAAQQLSFSFVDEQLPKKTVYYQLRMIDQQGVVNMSKIVTIFSNAEGWVINSMMPTLVTSQAKLNISASSRASIRLAVTDMYGRIVHQQQTALSAGSQDIWLNFSKLPAGAYQITGYLDNGQKTGSFRFIKQ
ncbi:hypothetical protein [Pseudoflavitalea rhizosphaerae]|uniref:hypothetical protein n=1 Tax=Pseudoflavitalea rhizosphaerae TaxID=1884793 RepID=UPI000F8D1BF0|nr:hypothetical protein [Pseudoflavitalea rhizosphaerae]